MKRKFTEKLLYWREHDIQTPLIVTGARQTGKTYVIDEFCKQNFEEYLYFNFEFQQNLSSIFQKTLNPKEIVRYLEVEIGRSIDIQKTIFFFDEIQICEQAITSLKYFCEAPEEYKIICAGSLLGVKLNRFRSSFPVGKVRILELFPMNFEEFLWALGENKLAEMIAECYQKEEAMVEILHEKALKIFQDYLIIGGMPRAVLDYLKNDKDVMKFDKTIHESILTSYIADMRKYTTSAAETIKINEIYESIPRQLARENTKFQYKLVKETANKRDYELPLDWLIAAGMVYQSIKVEKMQSPLKAYIEQSHFKIYFSDVGLLATLSNVSYKDILVSEDNIFKGALTENYVAQTLKSNAKVLYYFKPGQNMEIDFVTDRNEEIVPIEVKAGTHVKANSLKQCIEKYKMQETVRISYRNFGNSNHIFSVPLYAVHLIQ